MKTLQELGMAAQEAKPIFAKLTTEEKNKALIAVADGLVADADKILEQNAIDMENGKKNNMKAGLLDRLLLTKERIEAMAEGLRQIAGLEDPVGEVLETFERPNGLKVVQKRVPIGVIGIIYEARPNVTADAFGLCFKTGNVVILKGGKDALHSNVSITDSIRNSLEKIHITPDVIQQITDTNRETTKEFMRLNSYIDVLIPRGGAGLIRTVVENATVPVIETGTGNCHIYVDKAADIKKAIPIIINAKTQRIGVCNACESLVIHEGIKDTLLPALAEELRKHKVEMRGDEVICDMLKDVIPATSEDWGTEYLDYIISMKTVKNVEEAIAHINKYNTKHSEAIITEDVKTAEKFLNEIDAAAVYVNASTRFTDGFEFGFGAEIGISTQKLHARGPMGLKALTSYKYVVYGSGQIRK